MIIEHLKTKIQTKITKFIELFQFRDFFNFLSFFLRLSKKLYKSKLVLLVNKKMQILKPF
jgi:hypothetical protein